MGKILYINMWSESEEGRKQECSQTAVRSYLTSLWDCMKWISTFHRTSQLSHVAELYDPRRCSRHEIAVWKKTHSPCHTSWLSFADFFFLTAFPRDLIIGISLPCPSFRLTSPSSFFSTNFSTLWFSVQFHSKHIIHSVCCMQDFKRSFGVKMQYLNTVQIQ